MKSFLVLLCLVPGLALATPMEPTQTEPLLTWDELPPGWLKRLPLTLEELPPGLRKKLDPDFHPGHKKDQETPPVPEPSSFWLLSLGLLGLVAMGGKHGRT